MKRIFAVFALAVISSSLQIYADLTPVSVTGWDEDIVIGTGETYSTGSTAQMDDAGVGSGATVWYEQGFNTGSPSTGLATNLLQSATSSDLYFQFQSFTNNNALFEGGTLSLTTATAYDRIALIGATGQGSSDLTVTFSYTTGSDSVFSSLGSGSINQDWFNGSSIAYTASGRVSTVSGNFEYVGSSNPRLYETLFDIDETRLLESVAITDNETGNQHNVIMAISGEAVPEPAMTLLFITGGLVAGLVRWFYSKF
jgi:hypothetical protein